MNTENFLALGERLAQIKPKEHIAYGWLPDDAPLDFDIRHGSGKVTVLIKRSALPIAIDETPLGLILLLRKLRGYGFGRASREIALAEWPASGHLAMMPKRDQERYMREGIDVLQEDGQTVARKMPWQLTTKECEMVFTTGTDE